MSVELNFKKSMICLDDEWRAIACMASVTFIFDKLCISKIKRELFDRGSLLSGSDVND